MRFLIQWSGYKCSFATWKGKKWHEAAPGEGQTGHQEQVLHWGGGWVLNRLPRGMVTPPSLPELKEHLDEVLSHVIWFWFRQSCEEQGAGLDDPSGSLPTGDKLWLYEYLFRCSSSCAVHYLHEVKVAQFLVVWTLHNNQLIEAASPGSLRHILQPSYKNDYVIILEFTFVSVFVCGFIQMSIHKQLAPAAPSWVQ